jgi:plasmid stabilization system protein ParE
MLYTLHYTPASQQDLQNIHAYIKEQDSTSKADTFIKEVLHKISSLTHMPFRCRKSFYHEDENHRDLIYKGYTTVFRVDKNRIIILSTFRQHK